VLAWSPDGALVATGARDGAVRLWDRAGKLVRTLQGPKSIVLCGSWSADGTLLAACHGDAMIVWDVQTGLRVTALQGHGAAVYTAALIRDGRELITTGSDGAARRWTTAGLVQSQPLVPGGMFYQLARCERGRAWLTVGSDGSAARTPTDGRAAWRAPTAWHVESAHCATEGRGQAFVTTDGTIQIMAAPDGPARAVVLPDAAGAMVAMAPSGGQLALVDPTLRTRLIDPTTGAITATIGPGAVVGGLMDVRYVDAATIIASTSAGFVVLDGATARRRFEVALPEYRGVRADVASGSVVTWSRDYALRRYALADGSALGTYQVDAYPTGAAIAGDLLYAGLDDGAVVTFDLASATKRGLVGYFGSDVLYAEPTARGLLWVGTTGRELALVEPASGAVLLRAELPGFPQWLEQGTTDDVALITEGGRLILARLSPDTAPLARLEDELACRVPFELAGGALTPRPIDLAACGRLGVGGAAPARE
jgi:hypothetical protein